MIKAFILWMLGATFEVRLVSCKTGKDIPGRCLHKGGYWKARKTFRRRRLNIGYVLRLQAVSLLSFNDRATHIPKLWSKKDVEKLKDSLAGGEPSVSVPVRPGIPYPIEYMSPTHERSENEGVEDTESKSRWPDDDSHAAAFAENDDHECNSDGPLEWDNNIHDYVATCGICDAPQPSEDIADSGNPAHQA